MTFIKAKRKDGTDVLINLENVTTIENIGGYAMFYFCSMSNSEEQECVLTTYKYDDLIEKLIIMPLGNLNP